MGLNVEGESEFTHFSTIDSRSDAMTSSTPTSNTSTSLGSIRSVSSGDMKEQSVGLVRSKSLGSLSDSFQLMSSRDLSSHRAHVSSQSSDHVHQACQRIFNPDSASQISRSPSPISSIASGISDSTSVREALSRSSSGSNTSMSIPSEYAESDDLQGIPGEEAPLTLMEGHQLAGKKGEYGQISHDYKIGDRVYGHQTIEREKTIDFTIAYATKMLGHYEQMKRGVPKEKQGEIEENIAHYKQVKENAERYKEDGVSSSSDKGEWVGADTFRDTLREADTYEGGVKSYIPGAVNMRYQKLEVDGQKEMGFYRVGVMSDMRNGWVSLTDLNRMHSEMRSQQKPGSEVFQSLDKQIKTIKSEVSRLKKKEASSRSKGDLEKADVYKRQKESGIYALNQLEAIREAGISGLTRAIADRERILEGQMIQLIVGQIKQNPEKFKKAFEDGSAFSLIHVALLNQKSTKIDDTGWVHDERVEIEDMQEIFKKFQGKKLIFDGTGPLIDGEGVHLGDISELKDWPKIGQPPVTVRLNTFFFNTSVQGNVDNNETQRSINSAEMKRLLDERPESPLANDSKLQKTISSGDKSGYHVAEDFLVSLLQDDKLCVSTGCLSAKDRTGFVAERITQRFVVPHLPSEITGNPFEKDIFKKESPAVKVVKDNTPYFNVLKVDPRANLRGYSGIDKVQHLGKMVFATIRLRRHGKIKSASLIAQQEGKSKVVGLPRGNSSSSTNSLGTESSV